MSANSEAAYVLDAAHRQPASRKIHRQAASAMPSNFCDADLYYPLLPFDNRKVLLHDPIFEICAKKQPLDLDKFTRNPHGDSH